MPPPTTKNLGLVKAIHVGVNPPINKVILWYDTNPNQNIHKYWDLVALAWLPLGGSGSSSSSGFPIPQVQLMIRQGLELKATWLPSDTKFLNYNPEIWLFRWRQHKKKKNVSLTSERVRATSSGFRHPVHQGGSKHVGDNKFTGGTADSFLKTTEFSLNPTPFALTDINININEWVNFDPDKTGIPTTIPFPIVGPPFVGILPIRARYDYTKRAIFKFAIVIDNPNTNDLQNKKLIGPLSDSIILQPIHSNPAGNSIIGYRLKHYAGPKRN